MNLPQVPSAKANGIMLLLAIAAFASQAMVRVVDTLLPQIAADFMITVGTASIIVTVYAIAHGVFVFVAGPIGDRFGKPAMVTVACAISAVTVLACGLAQSLPGLAIARFASGMTVAWIVPLGLAFVADIVPEEKRQQVLARYMSGQILGQLFGQAAGGLIGDHIGWRGVFILLAAAFALVAGALAWQLLSKPLKHFSEPARPNKRRIVTDYAAVFSNPWARVVLLTVFFEGMFSFGIFAFVGADLHSRLGLSLTSIGAIVALFAVGGLIYGAMAGPLVKWMGPVGLAIAGGGFVGCGFFVLAVQTHWWSAPVAVAAIGIGFYMLHSTLLTNATQMCPHIRGTAVAVFGATLYLGQTVGVALSGMVVDGLGTPVIFLAGAVLMPVVATRFAFQLRRRSRVTDSLAQALPPPPRETESTGASPSVPPSNEQQKVDHLAKLLRHGYVANRKLLHPQKSA
jgi:predicted MFS family arabinose efflux permease